MAHPPADEFPLLHHWLARFEQECPEAERKTEQAYWDAFAFWLALFARRQEFLEAMEQAAWWRNRLRPDESPGRV
jgi:hypothetical protein